MSEPIEVNEALKPTSISVSCPLCKFFSPNMAAADGSGSCHKHTPAAVCIGMNPTNGQPMLLFNMWPPVQKNGWCAEGQGGISIETMSIGKDLLAKGNGNHGVK